MGLFNFNEPTGLVASGAVIFVTSLLGSLHCAGMCGPLFASVERHKDAAFFYHIGRFIGYLSLGALSGFFGKAVSSILETLHLTWLATLAVVLLLLYSSYLIWRGRTLHLKLPFEKNIIGQFQKVFRMHSTSAKGLLTGLLTTFLPCGWLYTFVALAVNSQSIARGAIILFLFWMGTVPALSISHLVLRASLQQARTVLPKITALLFLFIALGAVAMKLAPNWLPIENQGALIFCSPQTHK